MQETTNPGSQRWLMYAGIAIVLVFVAAMLSQFLRLSQAERTLDETRRELAVAQAEATLGASALEAQRGSYEVSRQLASQFFTQMQTAVDQAPTALRPQLQRILEQRDATITLLSRQDPQAAAVLARMFTQYRTALHGPEATLPMAAPVGAPAGPDAGAAAPGGAAPGGTTGSAPPPGSDSGR